MSKKSVKTKHLKIESQYDQLDQLFKFSGCFAERPQRCGAMAADRGFPLPGRLLQAVQQFLDFMNQYR